MLGGTNFWALICITIIVTSLCVAVVLHLILPAKCDIRSKWKKIKIKIKIEELKSQLR